MNLDEEDCEDLAVKAFQLKLLRGRLDQGNERISTTYAIKREFGPEDWKNLKNKVMILRGVIIERNSTNFYGSIIMFSSTFGNRI